MEATYKYWWKSMINDIFVSLFDRYFSIVFGITFVLKSYFSNFLKQKMWIIIWKLLNTLEIFLIIVKFRVQSCCTDRQNFPVIRLWFFTLKSDFLDCFLQIQHSVDQNLHNISLVIKRGLYIYNIYIYYKYILYIYYIYIYIIHHME